MTALRRSPSDNPYPLWVWMVLGFAVFSLLGRPAKDSRKPAEPTTYSQYLAFMNEDLIVDATVTGRVLRSSLKDGRTVEVHIPSGALASLIEKLTDEGVSVSFKADRRQSWITILLLAPLLFLAARWSEGVAGPSRMTRQTRQHVRPSLMENRALRQADGPGVTFADVAGAREAKEELEDIVHFLDDPQHFVHMGVRIPHGVLLTGPPGVGKTLLAQAIAGEARVPFFCASASSFVQIYAGMGASRVRTLFLEAKRVAPAIIFIDEIDSIGGRRDSGIGNDEREQTLNQLLVEMDGFESASDVIVIAATNRADMLDPALVRAGRFDRRIPLSLPDRGERLDILQLHARSRPLASEVDLDQVASETGGFSGADLRNLLNEAAILAARRNRGTITRVEIDKAIERHMFGLGGHRRTGSRSERERRAYHEAGHAVAAYHTLGSHVIQRVALVRSGSVAGYTVTLTTEERLLLTKGEIEAQLVRLMGGRAAEILVLGESSTMSADDLEAASDLAHSLVTKWGMSSELGLDLSSANSRNTAVAVLQAVQRVMLDAYNQAQDTLTHHVHALHQVANALLEHDTIDGETFRKLVDADVPNYE